MCRSGQCNDVICDDINKKCVSPTTMDCECKPGFLTGRDGECIDINECSTEKSCYNGKCSNLIGSFSCSCTNGYAGTTCSVCDVGYSFNEDRKCRDVDECLRENQCSVNAYCRNTIGSYECKCNSDYWGDGKENCTNHAVLALNTNKFYTRPRKNWAILVDSHGDKTDLSCFQKGEHTEAYKSCSVTWKNQMIVFGGEIERQQISRLDGYELTRIGQLSFDFRRGACTVFNQKFIFLCFSDLEYNNKNSTIEIRQCRQTSDLHVQFSKTTPSKHGHAKSAISASNSKFKK